MDREKAWSRLTPEKRSEYLNQTELKAKGWTKSLIEFFLGETADEFICNPRRKTVPIRLWLKSRIARIEATDKFRAAQEVASRRSMSAARAVATKRSEVLKQIDELKIDIPVLEWDELIRLACESYNAHHSAEKKFCRASPNDDEQFLERIALNYVRHELTRYDRSLNGVSGVTAASEARELIRDKILTAIEDAYPDLMHACDKQRKWYEDNEWDGT